MYVFSLENIKERISRKAINCVAASRYTDSCAICISKNANKEYQPFGVEHFDKEFIFDRIRKYNDITYFDITYDNDESETIYVDYNSVVKKGDMLAELDPSLFQSNVDQSTAKLNNAKATLARATASLNYKKNNYQRYKNLYAKNYVSKDEVELAYANYQQALAEVASASAEVNASQASLNNNLTNLGYSKITSPVDGTVISRAVDVGQTVAASFNTPTLFEVAKDLTQMQIETSVSEADIGKIKVGQSAKYTLDGYQDKTFEGKVTQVRLASTTTNNVVTYTVIISVDNSEGFVIPGMTANVSIITSNVENALCVPNQALKFSPADNTKKYEKALDKRGRL